MLTTFISPFKLLIFDRSYPKDILFFSTLLILIPVVLITGPALPDIFLSFIALYFLIISIYNKKWSYYKNPIFLKISPDEDQNTYQNIINAVIEYSLDGLIA